MEARRSFIKKIFAGAILCAVEPAKLFSQSANEESVSNSLTVSSSDIITLKREAKTLFYQRNYNQAVAHYQRLIELFPKDISCYDGLRKVFGAQQNTIEIVKLYENGLKNNPQSPAFYDRFAQSLMSIVTGNEKHLEAYLQISDDKNLYQKSVILYLKAIKLEPDKKYLYFGLADIWKKIECINSKRNITEERRINIASDIEEQVNAVLKKHYDDWAATRQSKKPSAMVMKSVRDIDFMTFIKKIMAKGRRTLYFEDEKLNRERNILKMKRRHGDKKAFLETKQANFAQLLLLAMYMLSDGSLYSNFWGILKKALRDKEQLKAFRLFYEQAYAKRNDSWGMLSKALYYKKCDILRDKALSIFNQKDRILSFSNAKKVAALYEGLAEIHIRRGEYTEAEKALQDGLDLLENNGMSLSLKIKYATLYSVQGDYDRAVSLLLYLVNKQKENSIQIVDISPLPALDGDGCNSGEYLKVYYALCKIRQAQGDNEGLNQAVAWIRDINMNDAFAKKMTNLI